MRRLLASAAAVGLAASAAHAQGAAGDNLDKLSQLQDDRGTTEFVTVEQTGEFADGIRANLERITLPDGFHIELYAVVPDARHMAVGPQGIVTFVGTRKTEVWAVTDRNKDRVADEVKNFAPSLAKAIPNGPCFSPDGMLYIAEQNRVLVYPAAEFFYEGPDVVAVPVIPQRRADPAGARELQPHRPGLPGRAGRQALHLARPAVQRDAARAGRAVQGGRHRRHDPGQPGRHGARGLHGRHPQLGRSRLPPRDRRALVHRQPGRRHGRRPAAGRDQPPDRAGPALRLPVVRRRRRAHQRVQGARSRRPTS